MKLHQRGRFGHCGCPRETDAEHQIQTLSRAFGLADDPPRHRLMRFDEDGVVQHHEGLQRCVRAAAADHADLAIARVEGREAGIRRIAPHFGVKTAAMRVLAGADGPVVAATKGGAQAKIRCDGAHGHAEHLFRKQTAHRKRLIAQQLARRTETRPTSEQTVIRIAFVEFRRGFGALAIRLAVDHQLEHVLEVPAAVHQLGGEPVEQFGMKRQVALAAKLLAAAHDAGAEEAFPQAIHGHAGGERVVAAHEPLRHREAVLRLLCRQRMEDRGRGLLHVITQGLPIAAKLHFRHAALLRIKITHDRHGDRLDRGEFLGRRSETRALGGGFFGDVAHIIVHDGRLLLRHAFRLRQRGDDIRRNLRRLLHTSIAGETEAEIAERVLLELALLLQGHAQFRTRRHHDGRVGQKRERVRFFRRATDGPALAFGFQELRRLETILRAIRQRGGEGQGHGSADRKGLFLRRRGRGIALPQDLAFLIQQHDAEPIETFAHAIEPVPHHHAIHRLRGLQINLPPRIVVVSARVRHAAFLVVAVRVAIIGTFRRGVLILAAVTRHALQRDVFRSAENLHFSQLQHHFGPRQLHADKSRQRSRFGIRRHHLGFEAGEHKIAKTCLRSRFEPQSAQFIARERQFDCVAGGVLVLREDHTTIVFDPRVAFTHFRRLWALPAQIPRKTAIPRVEPREPFGVRFAKSSFQRRDLGFQCLALLFQFRRVKAVQRHLVLFVAIRALIEEGVELEVLIDRERIVFVRVALRTGHRGAHPHREGRVHAVDDRRVAEFLVVRAAFVLRHRVAMKRRGDELVVRRIRQQIARVLLDGELIERHVRVQRTDDPVAVGPNLTRLITRIAGGVRVACQVQPLAGPVLAVSGLIEIKFHRIAQFGPFKTRQLVQCRRQPS